jgi:predicted alpha-1,6-mannanase (GH76 family)
MIHRLDHFVDAWGESMTMNPNWRRGQAFYNTLDAYDPATAEALRVSNVNPFYDDSNVPKAIWFIAERWEV